MSSLLFDTDHDQQQNQTKHLIVAASTPTTTTIASAPTPAGWNDPPPPSNDIVNNGQHSNGGTNRSHLQKLRRPVDPSIGGGLRTLVSPAAGAGQQQHQTRQHDSASLSLSAVNNHFHQSRSFPQLHMHSQSQHSPVTMNLGLGTHPNSAFTPTTNSASALLLSNTSMPQSQSAQNHSFHGLQPNLVSNPQMATASYPALSSPHPGFPATAAASVPIGGLSMAPKLPQPFAHHPPQPQQHPLANAAALIPQSDLNIVQPVVVPLKEVLPPGGQPAQMQMMVDSSAPPPVGHQMPLSPPPSLAPNHLKQQQQQSAAMLFSPPNIVPLDQCRPGTQPPATDPNNFRVPVKAAGDVSLSGAQLVAFLTKATLILPQGPMREGIQLRINQFGDLAGSRQISEQCIKKLNFVVDAIDRQVYEEAWQFFEQMCAAFPADCSLGGWAHGVRLLIQELRKGQFSPAVGTSRAHSAGARHF